MTPRWTDLARGAREPGRREHAVRATLCLTLPLLAGVLLGDAQAGLFASLGGFAGFSAQQEPYRRRARMLAVLALAYPLAVVLGTLAAPSGLAASLVPGALAAVAAFGALAFALPPPREYMLVMTCLLVTGLPADPGDALHRGLLAFAGAALAFVIAMAAWWRHPDRPQRRALAQSAATTADLLDALPDASGVQRHAAIVASRKARTTLAATGRAGDPLLPALRALEAACATALGMANVGSVPEPGQADRLRAAGDTLRGATVDGRSGAVAVAPRNVQAAHLEGILDRLEEPDPTVPDPGERPTVPSVGARLTAAADRNALVVPAAVRMGVAVAAGAGIGHALGLDHPYWAGLTAASVLMGATGPLQRRRARERAVGTVVGVVLAGLLLAADPSDGAILAVLVCVMLVVELVIASSYAIAVVFITPIPLLMMKLAGAPTNTATTGARLLDTLIGCAIGVVIAAIVWPRAATIRLPATVRRSFDATAACLRALIDPTTTPAAASEHRNRALTDLVTLRTVMDTALGERLAPAPEADRVAPIAGGVERLGYLVTGIPYRDHAIADADARAAVDRALAALGASLTEPSAAPPSAMPPLPELPRTHAELERIAAAVRSE